MAKAAIPAAALVSGTSSNTRCLAQREKSRMARRCEEGKEGGEGGEGEGGGAAHVYFVCGPCDFEVHPEFGRSLWRSRRAFFISTPTVCFLIPVVCPALKRAALMICCHHTAARSGAVCWVAGKTALRTITRLRFSPFRESERVAVHVSRKTSTRLWVVGCPQASGMRWLRTRFTRGRGPRSRGREGPAVTAAEYAYSAAVTAAEYAYSAAVTAAEYAESAAVTAAEAAESAAVTAAEAAVAACGARRPRAGAAVTACGGRGDRVR